MTITAKDVDIVARTLYGEAETNDIPDATAIAWVIRNRTALPNWPNTPSGVCLQPKQFSCWNDNDPNRQRIIDVKTTNPWFQTCVSIAGSVLRDENGSDPTSRATHYYATYMKKPPKWARGKTPCYEPPRVGKYQHIFFNNIDTPPPKTATEALDQAKPLSESSTMQAAGGLTATGTTAATKGAIDGNVWLLGIGVVVILIGIIVGYLRLRQRQKGEQ